MASTFQPGQFYGAVLRRREVAGFVLSEISYPGGTGVPPHAHAYGMIRLVRRGVVREIVGERARECAAPAVLVLPPEVPHSLGIGEGEARLFTVEFSPAWLARIRRQWKLTVRVSELQGGALVHFTNRLYKEFARGQSPSALAVESLLFTILSDAPRPHWVATHRAPPRWIEMLRETLHARFAEPLTLDRLADSAGVRASYLASTFRRCYGCSVRDYVRRLRLEYACRELERSRTPLLEISAAAGFCDNSHFTRIFKDAFGTTPGAYRRSSQLARTG